jgi:putative MATE family efflux protein
MKKGLLTSYLTGIFDTKHGESYNRILRYFAPECVSSFLLYLLPIWLDAYFVGSLRSTSTYATLGVTSTLIHMFVKVAESVSVGSIILTGKFNGLGEYKDVGRSVRDTFWLNCLFGGVCAIFLYVGAEWIYYYWYGVSEKMTMLGVPYLRLQALSLLFMFISMGFLGFLRGIKNTKIPMCIFIAGTLIFIVCDYIFIFGHCGFEPMGLQGSALASAMRYGFMTILAVGYTFLYPDNRKYSIELFSLLTDVSYLKRLVLLSWPVMIDKVVMAMSYVWLTKLFCPMGKNVTAAFCVIKDMERGAIFPAIALAQVITFLVSNDYGLRNWDGIKINIKKIMFIALIMVASILLIFSLFPTNIIQLFDQKGKFTQLAAQAFPLMSFLVLFDVMQLILAGALRGSGNVRTVMFVRLFVCLAYFIPVSYVVSQLPFENQVWQFVATYSVFYIGDLIMILAYIYRFRGNQWKDQAI